MGAAAQQVLRRAEKRAIPPVGMFDISAIIAVVIIWVLQAAVQGTLLRG